MVSFREIRFLEKREEIFNTAAEIFSKKGYEKTTIEEIATALRMTKSNVYYYFKGKEDILFQSLLRAHSLANEFLNEVAGKKGISPEDKLTLAIKEHVRLITRPFVYGTLRQHDLLIPDKLRREVMAERDKFQKTFVGIIQEGIEQGCFSKVNLKITVFAILGSVNWIARWYSPEDAMSPDEIGDVMAQYHLRGLKNTP